jgi:hypothetical protein
MQSLQTNMPNEQNLLLPKTSGFKLASLNVIENLMVDLAEVFVFISVVV